MGERLRLRSNHIRPTADTTTSDSGWVMIGTALDGDNNEIGCETQSQDSRLAFHRRRDGNSTTSLIVPFDDCRASREGRRLVVDITQNGQATASLAAALTPA